MIYKIRHAIIIRLKQEIGNGACRSRKDDGDAKGGKQPCDISVESTTHMAITNEMEKGERRDKIILNENQMS